MVWVGTSLPTCGLMLLWASTIKTGRRSDQHKMRPVHTHKYLHARPDLTLKSQAQGHTYFDPNEASNLEEPCSSQ